MNIEINDIDREYMSRTGSRFLVDLYLNFPFILFGPRTAKQILSKDKLSCTRTIQLVWKVMQYPYDVKAAESFDSFGLV